MLDLPPVPPAYVEVAAQLAQDVCDGKTVTMVEIRRHAPSPGSAAERAVLATSERVGLEFPASKEPVIRAYVRLKPGSICTERSRRDAERMLRAQPFASSAAVSAIPDGEGRVRIRVDVVNEFPWVVGGRLGKGVVDEARLGTLDLGGRGLAMVASGERGAAYRPGFGVLLEQYGTFGQPAVSSLEIERRPLGGLLHAGLSEPYLTDDQRYAFDASFTQETGYATLVRPDAGDAAALTRRTAYHVGVVKRVGRYDRSRVIGLAGLMLVGADIRTGNDVVVVSDSGLVPTSDSVLSGRFPSYALSRLAAVGGVRALRFVTARRFDALRAAQDLASGVQANLLVGRSLGQAARTGDLLIAGDLYVGTGDEDSFAALQGRVEGRSSLAAGAPWDGVVGSARVRWYRLVSDRRTRIVTLSGAALGRMPFPAQLTLRDPDGGLLGFPGSHGAGGRRVAVRVEERVLLGTLRSRADVAIALFGDAGRLWAGDVPYGAPTPIRSSAGLSLMAAYPSGGKRIFRLDIGVPLNPERGGSGFAIRVSVADRTSRTWTESREVARARSGPGPATFARW